LTKNIILGIIQNIVYQRDKINNTIVFLSRAGGGKSPMKPGNRLNTMLSTVLNLAAIRLKDEKMLVCDANLFFCEEVFYVFSRKED
jgi:hypothetical protein